MKSFDKKFMVQAISTAKSGIIRGQTPFGACIVKNGKIISCAHNNVWKNSDITAHAEIVAIRKACKKLRSVDLSGCTIYSTCEPCPMCFSACHWARIKTIVYGAKIRDAKKYGFNELNIDNNKMKLFSKSKVKIKKDFMKQETLELFKIWAKTNKGKAY